jgi:hypothetical protein
MSSMTQPSPSYVAEPTRAASGPSGMTAAERQRREKLAAWVRTQFDQARPARWKFERQWYLNLQFYRGNQNVEFKKGPLSQAGYRLAVPPAPPWRVRAVINRIRPAARREMSRMTAQKPTFVVAPATADDADQAAARVGEQLLEARYSDLRIPEVQRLWVWWAVICGSGFVKDYWDKSKGPEQAVAGGMPMKAGDTCVDPVDPFHIFVPDLREPTIDGQPWVIHAATHPREYVRRYYGIEDPGKMTGAVELFTDDLLSGSAAPKPSEQVLVLECWLQPGAHPDFPAGAMATVVGNQVALLHDYAQQGPVYQHGELPFTKLDMIPTGIFYGESSLTDLIPLQRLYNRQRSQIIESANMMGRPKWLAPTGSVNGAQIDSEPGQVIFYQSLGAAPTPVQMPPLPEYVQAGPGVALQDMDDISGQHEISRGSAPGQVTAATAISYLQEQDDTMMAWAVNSLEDGMARLGRHLLSHVVQFWGQQRLVQVVGNDMTFDAVQMSGSMLRGNTDVRVQAGSALPTSRAAKQATVLELYKLAAFGAPGSPEATTKLLEVLDMAGMEQALEEWRIDQREARRENTMMAAGRPVQVQPWQNHAVHIGEHNRFRKGQQFLALPPELQQIWGQHVQAHEEAAMQQKMVASMAAMGPVGPGSGPDVPPGEQGPGGGPGGPSGGEAPGGSPGPGGPDPGTLDPAAAGGPQDQGGP